MCLGLESHGPSGLVNVTALCRRLPCELCPKASFILLRKKVSAFGGGAGMCGQLMVDLACHFPVKRCPGIIVPRSVASSAMVITLRYMRT